MPDDIVTFGSPRDGNGASRRNADEIIRSLFLSGYADLVRLAREQIGDQAAADRIVQDAYLRLWNDIGRRGAPEPSADQVRHIVLELTGASPAGGTAPAQRGRRRPAADAGGADAGGAGPDGTSAEDPPDPERGWAALAERRAAQLAERQQRRRRGGLALGAVVVLAAAAMIGSRIGSLSGTSPGPRSTGSSAGNGRPAGLPPLYPGAVVARIKLSGVIDLAGDRRTAWVIRKLPPAAGPASYQLVRIDAATGRIGWRRNLGHKAPASMAADAAGIWLTTGRGQDHGQIQRFAPGSGRLAGTLHLPAGRCLSVSLVAGHLLARCLTVSQNRTVFLRINPLTGQVGWRGGPVTKRIFAVAAAPRSVWYDADYSGTYGLISTANGGSRRVTVYSNHYPANFAYTRSLVYSQGFIWSLNSDENVAKIDPKTGDVLRSYSYRSYDPVQAGGLDYFTVSAGSLWFLDDGYPFSGVLRVSAATGRPVGAVRAAAPGSCLTVCSQIYATPGSIWVPTQSELLRIAPGKVGP